MFFPPGKLKSYIVIATEEDLSKAFVERCSNPANRSFIMLDRHRYKESLQLGSWILGKSYILDVSGLHLIVMCL